MRATAISQKAFSESIELMETALSECVPDEDWLIVLFYQYCHLESPSSTCEEQLLLCRNLNLLGRVRVSPEGINGTLGGSSTSIHRYIEVVDKILEFEAVSKPIHWKLSGLSRANLSSNCDHKLKTLSVKVVKEVVSLDLSTTATFNMIKGARLIILLTCIVFSVRCLDRSYSSDFILVFYNYSAISFANSVSPHSHCPALILTNYT